MAYLPILSIKEYFTPKLLGLNQEDFTVLTFIRQTCEGSKWYCLSPSVCPMRCIISQKVLAEAHCCGIILRAWINSFSNEGARIILLPILAEIWYQMYVEKSKDNAYRWNGNLLGLAGAVDQVSDHGPLPVPTLYTMHIVIIQSEETYSIFYFSIYYMSRK